MKIDNKTLEGMAHLSRLNLDQKDVEELKKDMSEILDWVEKLDEVDTEGVAPLTTMSHEINAVREDKTKPHLSHEKALKNAPKKDSDYFRVPKVLD